MGGDYDFLKILDDYDYISIHASVWEATRERDDNEELRIISIHASVWEATYKPVKA